jgi:hypothetical protein
MPIPIPVDVHLVTITVMDRGGPRPVLAREIDFGLDAGLVQTGIGHVNRIWRPDFQFNKRTIQKVRSNPPGDTGVIGDQEKWFLFGQYPARSGVSVVCVRQIGRVGGAGWVAGTSARDRSVAMIGFTLNPLLWGQTLAHEFGHLLCLEHVSNDSGNLMYPSSQQGISVTPAQRRQALDSPLARRFRASPRP